jgi:O-antigen/teichoic acid export membrane protein
MQLFYPLINKEYSKGNKEGVKQMSKQVGKWILIINLPVIILLITFPGVFLNLLFGEAYLEATGALRILAIGFFFISLLGISNRLISMTGRSKILFLDIIVVATINVILNIILIPRYGLTGAAIATSVSFGLISVISASQAYYYLKIIPIRRKMFNIVISGLISFGALLYLKAIVPSSISSLIILAVFFLTLYLFLVYIFKGFDKNDIMVFRSLLRRVKE